MKNYRKFLIFIIFVILAGFVGGIFFVLKHEGKSVDMVTLNDIANTALTSMVNGEDLSRMREFQFSADYCIFDMGGQVAYSTKEEGYRLKLSEAVSGRYPIMPIQGNGIFYGSAVILEDMGEIQERQNRILVGTLVFSGMWVILCALIWGAYVNWGIIKPFRKMERFAGEIASGNLDANLEMDKNNMFGIFTESFDIMREELNRSRQNEIRLKQQEKEMVASLSHDLKTPITGIKVTSELMQVQTADPDAREKLDNIYKKAEQIDALVTDLFTATLKDLGEMDVRVNDENSGILHEFVMRHDYRNKARETEIPECLISIDPKRMEQIVGNVISNSYKYADTDIEIRYQIIEAYLEMSIRDFGQGVPEEEVILVTNKFYRSTVTRENKTEGSGLGLYIAKTLIEKMNGEIRCRNAGPGFDVRLLIPLS